VDARVVSGDEHFREINEGIMIKENPDPKHSQDWNSPVTPEIFRPLNLNVIPVSRRRSKAERCAR
jgi:hypothetical protein